MSILVSGILKSPAGGVIAGAQIILTTLTTSPDLLAGVSASAVTSDTGYYGLNVLPGAYSLTVAVNGKSQVYGSFRLDGTETTVTLNMVLRRNLVEVSIPDALLVDFRQIQNNVADDLETMRQLKFSASGSADNAARAAADAKVSAEAAARSEANAADSEKSAERFAQNLQDAVTNAGNSASDAALSASDAEKQAVSASGSAEEAKQAAITAATDAAEKAAPLAVEKVRENVKEYMDSASQSVLDAVNAKGAAEKAASGAALSEKNTAGSALAARTSEINAAGSVTKAAASAAVALVSQNAAKSAETNALTSANAAKVSETGASESALNAGKSAATVGAKATEATASATAAEKSATLASGKADVVTNLEYQAGLSRDAAKASETAAALSQTAAKASESASAFSQRAAKASEDAASASVAAARISQSNATDSAAAALASQKAAKVSEDAAKASQVAASASAGEAKQAALDARQAATKAAADAVAGAVPAAVEQVKTEIAGNVTRAETAAGSAETSNTGAQKALEEAKLIAKTPGLPGLPGKDGESAYQIWKKSQPEGTDTSLTAYMAIYDDIKNLRSTNIGGKSVPFILVEQIKQITDLPTGTFVEVQSVTGLLPLVDTAYLSVIANNFGSNKNAFVLYGKGSGRVWTGYRNDAVVAWKELGSGGSSGSGTSTFPKFGEVGSYVLGIVFTLGNEPPEISNTGETDGGSLKPLWRNGDVFLIERYNDGTEIPHGGLYLSSYTQETHSELTGTWKLHVFLPINPVNAVSGLFQRIR